MGDERKPFKLLVHEASFSEDELLVDRKWMPNVRNGSLLEIVHPAATDRRLVLRVALLGAGGAEDDNDGEASGMGDGGADGRVRMADKSADGDDGAPELVASVGADLRDVADTELVSARPAISVLKSVASLLALPTSSLSGSSGTAMDPLGVPHEVLLAPAVAGSCVVQFVEVTFVDVYISQADVWRLKHELVGGAIYLGQQLGSTASRTGSSSSSALSVGPAKTLVQVNELRGPSRSKGAGSCVVEGRDTGSFNGIGGSGEPLRSGIVTAGTKWVFRSCSARFIGLIPITRELFEFEGEQSPSRSCLEASSHIDGDHSMLLYERVGALMQELMKRWTSATGRVSLGAAGGAGGGHVRHSLTIVVFCRVCYTRDALTRAAWEADTSDLIFGHSASDVQPGVTVPSHNQRRDGSTNVPCLVRLPDGAAPLSSAFAAAGAGSAMGAYSDFYRIVVDNETVPEWETLCSRVRVAIADATHHMCSRSTLGRLAPRLEAEAQRLLELAAEAEAAATAATEEAREEDARRLGIGEGFADDEHHNDGTKIIARAKAAQANARVARRRAVKMELLASHCCEGVPSDAEFCPLLEATNLALNIFEKEYMDRDLRRSNQSLLVLSAGTGVFVVDAALERMTEQRLIDKGIGMDVVSVGSPPLHYVPLFVHASKPLGATLTPITDAAQADAKLRTTYSMPQWVQLYFHNGSATDGTAVGMDKSAETDEAWGRAPISSASVPSVLSIPQSAALPSQARANVDQDKHTSHNLHSTRVIRDQTPHSVRRLALDDTAADQAAFVPLPSTQFRLRLQQPYQTVALRALLHSADAQTASSTSSDPVLAPCHLSTATAAGAALAPPAIPALRASELDEAEMLRYDDEIFKRPQVPNDSDGTRCLKTVDVATGGALATENPRALAQHQQKAQGVSGCTPSACSRATISAIVTGTNDNTEDQLSELVDTKTRQLQQQQRQRFRAQQTWQKQWQRRRQQQQQQQQWQQQQRIQQQQRQQEQKPELTNPFCARSRAIMLNRTTANTRRWSQIFPGRQESTWRSTQRINWKGLVMPAMLPITTDYFPARSVLQTDFHETPPYNVEPPESQIGMDAMQLLRELVVQRLEQHFQLVHESQPTSQPQQHLQHQQQQQQAQSGQRVEYQRRLLAKGEVQRPDGGILSRSQTKHVVGSHAKNSLPMDAVSVSYWLSKGHRIHKLSCDAQAQHVTVRTFSQRHEERTTYNYRYALWQPLIKSFQPVTQRFAKFRAEKLNWNQLDTAISTADAAGSYIHDPRAFSQQQQMKRIRGSIVPPSAPSAADLDDYERRFHKFVAYLNSLRDTQGQHSGRRVEVVARPVRPNKRCSDASVRHWTMRDAFMPKAQMLRLEMTTATTAALMASGAGVSTSDGATAAAGASTRCEWLYIVYDAEFDPRECWHLEVHWFACNAGTVQEFLAAMRRKAKANGLNFVDVLEFSRQGDLSQSVNPFRAPILITPHAFGTHSLEAADAAIAEVELRLVVEFGFVGDGGFARTGCSGVYSDHSDSYVGGDVICRQYQHARLPIFVRHVHPAQLYWVMSRQAMSPELVSQTRALWRRLVVLTFAAAAWEVQLKRRAIKTVAGTLAS